MDPPSSTTPAAVLSRATTTHAQRSWQITARKLPISKAGAIEALERALGIPAPEMIFGDNAVRVRHVPTGWAVEFAAAPALDAVDKTGASMLRVAHASSWSRSREHTSAGITEVVRPFDWSYSTAYRGDVRALPAGGPGEAADAAAAAATSTAEAQDPRPRQFRPVRTPIPLELLKRRDPILFFDEVVLYESELDDNGTSQLSVKVRVMEHRMLLLSRLFMRVDDVVVRVRDTRVYVDFDTDEVIREYTAKEDKFGNVKENLRRSGLLPDAVNIALRDANQVANLLPIVEVQREGVSLSSTQTLEYED